MKLLPSVMQLSQWMLTPVVALLLLGQTSCSGREPIRPSQGSLAITATGMPPSVETDILVSGPGGTFDITSGDTVLRNLDPGIYDIAVRTTWVSTGRYVPESQQQLVEVTAGSTAPVSIAYTLWDSRLTLNISGLPFNASALVDITGPSFSTTATNSQSFGDLKAGDYTVIARDVMHGGFTYRATLGSQIVTLPAGTTPVVVTVSYTAASATP